MRSHLYIYLSSNNSPSKLLRLQMTKASQVSDTLPTFNKREREREREREKEREREIMNKEKECGKGEN